MTPVRLQPHRQPVWLLLASELTLPGRVMCPVDPLPPAELVGNETGLTGGSCRSVHVTGCSRKLVSRVGKADREAHWNGPHTDQGALEPPPTASKPGDPGRFPGPTMRMVLSLRRASWVEAGPRGYLPCKSCPLS